jgi:hypothetical protein
MSFEYSQTVLSQRIDAFNREIESLMKANPGIKPTLIELQLLFMQLGVGYWETLSQLEKVSAVTECGDEEMAELFACAAESIAQTQSEHFSLN